MKRNPIVFVKHILERIKLIESFSDGISKNELKNDNLRQSAIVRELEVIGEAVKNLPEDFIYRHPSIEWRKIAGLRDKLIHHYFGVDLDIVWGVVKKDLPKLKINIKKILDKEGLENE